MGPLAEMRLGHSMPAWQKCPAMTRSALRFAAPTRVPNTMPCAGGRTARTTPLRSRDYRAKGSIFLTHVPYHVARARLLAPVLLMCAACGADDADDAANLGDSVVVTMDNLFGCRGHEYRLPSMDYTSPLGFSVAELLARVSGSHTSTLEWLEPEGMPVWFERPGTEAALEIDLAYEDGELRYIESIDCSGSGSCNLTCGSRVDLDVRARFSSEDGLFDEAWDVALGAREVDTAFFIIRPFDPDATNGTLTSSAIILEDGYHVETFSIFAHFEDRDPSGYFDADVLGPGGGAFVPIGVWGLP